MIWDVIASEWIKLRSVRSTYWTLIIAAVTGLGLTVVIAISGRASQGSPLDPLVTSYVGWLEYPVLAVGVLGVLTISPEYSSGLIRTTYAAVPRRLAVLAAKAAAAGGLMLAVGEVLAVASFLLAQAILTSHHGGLSLAQPGVLTSVLAAGFVLVVIVLLGLGLGAAIRHTAGAVAALPAILYLPLAFLALPSPWSQRVERFTLPTAAYQLIALHPSHGYFTPAISLLIVLAWPAVVLTVAAVLVTRRAA